MISHLPPLLWFTYNSDHYTVILLFLCLVLSIVSRKLNQKGKQIASKRPTIFDPKKNFAKTLKTKLLGFEHDFEEIIPDLEEILLAADVGVSATEKLLNSIIQESKQTSKDALLSLLKGKIATLLTPPQDFKIDLSQRPYVIYLTGVNGSGKTTTIGKLACQYKKQGHKVMLVAADTFRAAAIDQLKIWAEKNAVSFMGGKPQADPSSVIVDGLRSAKAKNIDIVLVDTAGRLQTKTNLMNELKKMVRMSEKELGYPPHQTFLVVDAITGQNGFSQAKIFLEAIDLSGIILTKYDATAKGGIIISIVEQTKIPIRYVGLGEGIDDLKKFDAHEFVEKIFE